MLNIPKLLFAWISELSFKERLGESTDAFISEITYTNFLRIRILSMPALAIFLFLWIWDIIQFFDGKWNTSIGYQIITYLHSFLIIFMTVVIILFWKKVPGNPNSINISHKIVISCTLAILLICVIFTTLGDVMINGSIAAYLGMTFAYASIFVMTHRYSFILFGTNLIVMVFLLVMMHFMLDQPMDIQIINAVAFTIIALILSRVLFFYNLKDFTNRLVINEQSREIRQQNEMKEELISELKGALAEVKQLSGFLPICASCKKIRDDKGYWNQIESYISEHSEADFSHSICPECAKNLYSDLDI